MTRLTIDGAVLQADADRRTLTYRLLPFGEEGRTSLGRVTASAGAVTIPEDVSGVVLNLGHDRDRPAGRAAAITEGPDGIDAVFTVARVPAGDQLLAEAAEGLRTGASVELDDVVIRDGRLLGGALTDVGAVVRPAFPSAQLVAADAGDDPEDDEDDDLDEEPHEDDDQDPDDDVDQDDDDEDDDDATASDDTPTQEDSTMTASARAAAGRNTARAGAGGSQRRREPMGLADAFRLTAEAFRHRDSAALQQVLTAALSDVPYNTGSGTSQALGPRTTQPGWLGELWSGREYQRRYVPLLASGALTDQTMTGWRWSTKPVVADYAGNKTAVPSAQVGVESASASAERCAGAWDIDRAFWDFGNTAFIESFWRATTESYAKLSDLRAGLALVEAATANPTAPGAVPDGVSPAMAAIVDGALAVLDEGLPTFALVGKGLYRDVLLTRNDDTLAFLNASLGLEEGTISSFKIVPGQDSVISPTAVAVGVRGAVTFYELGSTPIRVEAENIANGGRDLGAFGYTADMVNDADAITLVETVPTP